MKQNLDMDILNNGQELKENPFVVPEGYFEAMKESASRLPDIIEAKGRKLRRILVPVFSAAASVVLILSGVLLFDGRRNAPGQVLYSEASGLSADEIAEYLIYTGISVEDINAGGGNE